MYGDEGRAEDQQPDGDELHAGRVPRESEDKE